MESLLIFLNWYWHHRATMNPINFGDMTTTFFHNIANGQREKK